MYVCMYACMYVCMTYVRMYISNCIDTYLVLTFQLPLFRTKLPVAKISVTGPRFQMDREPEDQGVFIKQGKRARIRFRLHGFFPK